MQHEKIVPSYPWISLFFISVILIWGRNVILRFWMPLNSLTVFAFIFQIPMSRSFAIMAFTLTQPGGRERSYQEIKNILKHMGLWPVQYPKPLVLFYK